MRTAVPDAFRDLAGRQRGVIGRRQALATGMRPDVIDGLLRTGRWQRLDQGVYAAFTGEPCREARLWAVSVRAGPDAAFSHRTAAELFGLSADPGAAIHIAVPRDSRPRRIPGVVIHRVERARDARHPALLPPRTRVEETVLDLAATARSLDDAFGWIFRATGQWLTSAERIRQAMAARQRMRWRAELAGCLDDVDGGVRSNLEHRYVGQVERPHGLPRAVRQARVIRSGRVSYLDNLYEDYLVCVELHGRRIRPWSAGGTTAGTTPARRTGSSPCGTAGPTSPDSHVRLRPRSPLCCASVAGTVLHAAAALGAR